MPKSQEKSQTFTTTLLSAGKSATGFVIPADVVEALSDSKRPPVTVTIGTHTYQNTVAVMGGQFMIGVSAENRTAADVKAGDEITVTLTLDSAPREYDVPADFAKALKAAPSASAFFEKLPPSMKKYHVGQVTDAKTPETRARRIEKAVALFVDGKQR
jgi:hypothetical protein